MLECKRFYCKKDGNGEWTVSDKLNQFPMPISSLEFCTVVADALNNLWNQTLRFEKHNQELVQRSIKYEDKIDELKNENKEFRNIARDYNIPFDKLCSTFEDVLEENEWLKSLLNEISDKNNKIWLNDGRIIRLREVSKGEWK